MKEKGEPEKKEELGITYEITCAECGDVIGSTNVQSVTDADIFCPDCTVVEEEEEETEETEETEEEENDA